MRKIVVNTLFVLLGTYTIGPDLRADDIEDGRRVHRAVVHLRDEVFNNCIVKFQMDFNRLRNDKLDASSSAKCLFGRRGPLVLSDVSTTYRAADGGPESIRSLQRYVSNVQRCIDTTYVITKADRKIQTVFCDPKRTYDDSYRGLTQGVRLNYILNSFGPFDESIADVVSTRNPVIKRNSGSSIIAQYTTEYGLVEATLERLANRDRLVEVRITQSAKDVHAFRTKGATLAEMHQSILDETPDGLTSVIHGFRISYDENSTRPFTVLTIFNSYAAAGKNLKSENILRLTDYKKCNNDAEIEAMRIPIPEGERVGLVDDPYKGTLALTYRNGEVVRQVDGASLEEVVTEERFHKKFLYIVVSIVGILCIAFGFRYTWKRWAAKSKGQSP